MSCSAIFENKCNGTQVCHNCYISTLGEFGCVQTLTSMFGPLLSESQCIAAMWTDTALLGVDYDPDASRCRGYYCDYGLGYSSSGRTVFRKTCDIGMYTYCSIYMYISRNSSIYIYYKFNALFYHFKCSITHTYILFVF